MTKNKFYIVLPALLILILMVPAQASSFSLFGEKDGGDIYFEDTKAKPPVLFSHQIHKQVGNKCPDCHDKIFKKKKGSTDVGNALTMRSIKRGKFCGTCHNGKKAFKAGGRYCKKCHVKSRKR